MYVSKGRKNVSRSKQTGEDIEERNATDAEEQTCLCADTERKGDSEKSLSDSVDRQMSETDVSEGVRVGDSANISISV